MALSQFKMIQTWKISIYFPSVCFTLLSFLSHRLVFQRAEILANLSLVQAQAYTTNNIMLTMGQDFTYMNAHSWYKARLCSVVFCPLYFTSFFPLQNIDKLLDFFRSNSSYSNLNFFYSTPSIYIKAVTQANSLWTVKTDDFFPYGEYPHSYWTGYFTSRSVFLLEFCFVCLVVYFHFFRPALKGYVRQLSSYLQTCRQLEIFAPSSLGLSSYALYEAMAIAQHHDAVTGTEVRFLWFLYRFSLFCCFVVVLLF
jgi:hypothetical protein